MALAEGLKDLDVDLYLHWVPAHKGIPGNMLADQMAKRATHKKF